MQPARVPWWKRSLVGLTRGSNVGSLLFALTAAPLCAWLYGRGVRDLFVFSLACLPFALSVLLFVVVCALVPALIDGRSTGFPLNVTLPLVYCSFVFVVAQVLATLRPPIALIGEEPRVDQLAGRPDLLGIGFVLQFVGLTLSAGLSREKGGEA